MTVSYAKEITTSQGFGLFWKLLSRKSGSFEMTVTYTSEVATAQGFGVFVLLLRRWRGSIYKLIWADLIIYIVVYYIVNSVYRFALNKESQQIFERVVEYCSKYGSLIPLSFVLGFYVNIVMTRWWNQYETIPSPDNLAMLISASIKGNDEHCRIIRRTIARYACLSFTSTLTLISPKVKRRFPTLKHLTDAGLMMPDEERIMQELQEEYPNYPRFWLPLAWASNIAAKAREEGLIRTDQSLQAILHEINNFRSKCGGLLSYDWISIPLVYTQVVTIAVYSYFVTSVIGQQYLFTSGDIDLYFPFLAVLEFFFYMGWLRVAETLINPFGEDDDDFDVVWMIDRNLQVSYLIVDKMHEDHPKLMQDQYWNSLVPRQLPHTIGSEKYIDDIPNYSTEKMTITAVDAEVIPLDSRKGGKNGSFKRNQPSLIRRLLKAQTPVDGDREKNLVPLTSVATDSGMDQVALTDKSNTLSTKMQLEDDAPPETIDFEKLKKLRQLLLKQRVMKCMDLVRDHTDDEEEKIIDDILHLDDGEVKKET